jgi:methionine--tRNA ligase beta chain
MENINFKDFKKIDLRLGKIKEVEEIENSEKLFKLQVDLGEELGIKQILAGISKKYNSEELINKNIVVVVNLEPRKMMGFESEGMLLAVSDDDISLLTSDKDMKPGLKIG